MTAPDRVLLEETFYVLTKRRAVFRVRLTAQGLCLRREQGALLVKEQLIPIGGIVGARCLRGGKGAGDASDAGDTADVGDVCQPLAGRCAALKVADEADTSAYLHIYAYLPLKRRKRRRKLERSVVTLRFRSYDRYEDNFREAAKWRQTLRCLIASVGLSPVRARRLLILLSPKSGSGRGQALFAQKVAPLLDEADAPYELVLTEYAGHARQMVRSADLLGGQWAGVVAAGGDGVIFEVVNGLFERPDWPEVADRLAVGVLPLGSGNGLAASLAEYSGGAGAESPLLAAAMAIARGRQAPMDLVRVENKSKIMFSFLSVTWGLIADLDVESELLRAIGPHRFTIWSILRVISLRSYKGRLWYKPANSPNHQHQHQQQANGHADDEDQDEDQSGEQDAAEDELDCFEPLSEMSLETQTNDERPRLDSWYSAASRRSAYFSTHGGNGSFGTANDCSSATITPDDELARASAAPPPYTASSKQMMYGPASQLPALTVPLPRQDGGEAGAWRCLDAHFVMVTAVYQSHIGSDAQLSPASRLDDGLIWLAVIERGVTRAQLLSFFLGLKTGRHCRPDCRFVRMIACTAFRLEPEMPDNDDAAAMGHIVVDGELVEYGPIQAEVCPRAVKVMLPPL